MTTKLNFDLFDRATAPARQSLDLLRYGGLDESHRMVGGYAFETAICLIESLRPTRRRVAQLSERETQALELADRMFKLTRLLAAVEPHLGGRDMGQLHDTAAGVANDLITHFGDAAQNIADDSRCGQAIRTISADGLMQARRLGKRLCGRNAGATLQVA